MGDPREALSPAGTINTGADRTRFPRLFEPVLDAAVEMVHADGLDVSVYVYGSVATGQAQEQASDVDLLTIDLSSNTARRIGRLLSSDFAGVCRGVEIAVASTTDFEGDSDEAYGNRVFLRHYCVHLAGPDRDRTTADFAGDVRAARGFNGDIARHARRWRHDVAATEVGQLGRRIARKTLLAVAGLVSVHDDTWTTDRQLAVVRWSQIEPDRGPDLVRLLDWTSEHSRPNRQQVMEILDSTVDPIVERFAQDIGLWNG